MSGYLSMNPDGVRQQANSFEAAARGLSEAAGSWKNMFDPNDLGAEYRKQAQNIADGFNHVVKAVEDWSSACAAFGTALNHAADTVQNSDSQVSSDLAKVSFDGAGDLTMGEK
ncbi:hypothetical protein [Nocardia veterana]|uniref:Excreted virulence factor EspC (Type VII ESX diderm) n=1 Tax=Nocardia veterana TaxID=132249 RepID=A0A7X6RIC0_9NOCA|nr:hypothetical protein [Nocardia veterana]NKY86483.1 hypothetical protein [Nocardia veterana]